MTGPDSERPVGISKVSREAVALPASTSELSLEQQPSLEQSAQLGRSNLEPELGGRLRESDSRSGLEPELGGQLRQRGVYVDELTCIGCTHCAHVARNTFYIEEDHGRARVFRQNGDTEALIQEAIDTCPVDCIHWLDYTELKQKERDRKFQVIPVAGFPVSKALIARQQHQAKRNAKNAEQSRQ
ncbi:MAG: ferredoxin [Cyanobacteria bacterium J06627_15]